MIATSVYEIIDLICGVALAVAAGAGAIIAVMGLETWRRELRGRTEYDLARRILMAVYKARDNINQFRNGFDLMSYSEWADRPERDPNGESFTHEDNVYVYQKRWERLYDPVTQLEVELIEAEVLWGNMLKDCSEALIACISKLRINLRRFLRASRDERLLSEEKRAAMESILCSDDSNKDEFGREVTRAIEGFKTALLPFLKR